MEITARTRGIISTHQNKNETLLCGGQGPNCPGLCQSRKEISVMVFKSGVHLQQIPTARPVTKMDCGHDHRGL